MKAILIVEMPTDCIKCPLADGYCWNTFPTKGKADGCPLKPLPQKRKTSVDDTDLFWQGVGYGWNECLAKITGETE